MIFAPAVNASPRHSFRVRSKILSDFSTRPRLVGIGSPLAWGGFLVFTLVLLLCPVARGQNNKLNLFIWSEYIDPQIVADFERQFECKVTVDLYEDESSMMSKLQGGGASLYDVVVPPDHSVAALVKLKLIRPLPHDRIPNLKNVDEKFLSPPYDPGNKYTVPYQWGTVGIFLRRPAGRPVPDSWAVLFDAKQQAGAFLLIDGERDMIGAALKFLGYSLNSTNVQQLKQARALLLDAKKRSRGFAGSVGGKNRVLGKEIAAAIVYSGDAARAMSEDPQTQYFIPREGSQIWVDNLAIPAQAPHPAMAEKFLNFILDAKIGARLAAFTQFASPNHAARPFIRAADLNNPAIYPPPAIMSKLEFLRDLGKQSRLYDEIWTQVKSK